VRNRSVRTNVFRWLSLSQVFDWLSLSQNKCVNHKSFEVGPSWGVMLHEEYNMGLDFYTFSY
jgi:hypothetical protein